MMTFRVDRSDDGSAFELTCSRRITGPNKMDQKAWPFRTINPRHAHELLTKRRVAEDLRVVINEFRDARHGHIAVAYRLHFVDLISDYGLMRSISFDPRLRCKNAINAV